MSELNKVFVVPFFYQGAIHQMRVYSDPLKAQAALRRYVRYRELLNEVRIRNPGIDRKRAMLDAYGAIRRTPYAGTAVYEIEVDARTPVRGRTS
jgi:hypothetical protein